MRPVSGRTRPTRPPRQSPVPADNLAGTAGFAAFHEAQEAFLLIDEHHRLVTINPAAAALLGTSAQEARMRHWRDFFHLERELARDYLENPIAQCLRKRVRVRLPQNTLLACHNRRPQPIQGQLVPLDHLRQPMALLMLQPRLFAQVIDNNPESAQRFREHEALLAHMFRLNTVGELATGIAHEINQPLSAILSYSQAALRLINDDDPDIARASEAVLEAADQAKRAGEILRQLRAFASRQRTGFAAVAVNQAIMNSLTLLASPLQESGVQVTVRTEPCPPVLAESIQIEQVLVNLVRNAIDAMATIALESRLLRIASVQDGRHVRVEVRDSGPGFTDDIRDRLFTRFFSTKPDGMGLGLCISQTIIEAAGGELWAESLPEGGAAFCFRLPALIAEERQDVRQPA